MELAEFISTNRERIAAGWQAAALRIAGDACAAPRLAAADRSPAMLDAIVRDMAASGSEGGQTALTLREMLRSGGAGLDPAQLTAELQALKAVAVELWMAQTRSSAGDRRDMLRFDRAVDGAIAETIVHCKDEAERRRNAFLSLLGHDLRGPLAAIAMAGHYLEATGNMEDRQMSAVGSINRGAAILKALVRDMVEFSRSSIDGGISIVPEEVDVAALCRSAIVEVQGAHPDCIFLFDGADSVTGTVDRMRMQQLILNLLHNAVRHGTRRLPVEVAARREDGWLALSVTNHGPAIPAARLDSLFDPFPRLSGDDEDAAPDHLGLGLYIAREIAIAHKGDIAVASSEDDGTTFTVRVPG